MSDATGGLAATHTPTNTDLEAKGWQPDTAAATRPHLSLTVDQVAEVAGGGFYANVGASGFVVLAPRLTGWDRAAALTHELIHDERGAGDWTDAERTTEEATVRRLTRLRMAFYRPAATHV